MYINMRKSNSYDGMKMADHQNLSLSPPDGPQS